MRRLAADDFVFSISKDEYLDLLFEDLELPNLQQNQLDKLVQMKTHRAGFCNDGMPSNIDIVRSLQGSLARRVAMTAGKKRHLAELEGQLALLQAEEQPDKAAIALLERQIEELQNRIKAVPFHVLFNGCVWLDGSSNERHGKTLLYSALSIFNS
jgi:uncharacterized sporulation protein YeaH/YhbH (DUF444 family)